jgi:uncharacterized membrane protein YdbT with pleckstrin-like domain
MSYITDQLRPGENLVATARYHQANYIRDSIFFILGFTGAILILILTPGVSVDGFIHSIPLDYKKLQALLDFTHNGISLYFLIFIYFIILYLITFIMLFCTAIRLSLTHLALTNHRIIGKAGIITRKTLDTPLNNINTINITKGFIGSIFNYGKIHILTLTGQFIVKGIANPDDFKQKVFLEINRH